MTDQEKETVQGLVNIESAVIREEMDYDIKELKTNVATFTTNFKKNFRQCLPVCPVSNRAQIVNNCTNASSLWDHFSVIFRLFQNCQHSLFIYICMQVFYLLENMRVRASGDPKLEAYDTQTVEIGDGTSNDINGLISIPEDMLYDIKPNKGTNKNEEENSMKEFCRMIFQMSV